MSTSSWQRLAIISFCASATVFLGWCVWVAVGFLAPVLGLFFGGWVLALLQEPLVEWVTRRTHATRSTAVAATVLTVLLAVVVVGVLAAPVLDREVASSFANLPSQLDLADRQAVVMLDSINSWFAEHGVPLQVDLPSGPALNSIAQQMLGASGSPLALVGGVLGAFGRLGMMLLLSVFFLLGGKQLAEQVIQSFGSRAAPDMQFVLTAVHDAFEGFARAQLAQGVLFGAGVWACLSVVGVESAPLVGVVAGLMLLIPVVGSVLAVAIPVLAALLWDPSAALVVALVLVVLEQVVLNVVGPRLMSRQVGLPPLLVLFGILAGGQVGGFWGAVFGIPLLATVGACLGHFRSRWDSPTNEGSVARGLEFTDSEVRA
jgi:predicted PurR-regulated permease PerM